MKLHTKWLALSILVALVSLFSLAASENQITLTVDEVKGFSIAEYEFVVSGKTTKAALRNAIVPSSSESVYKTEQALVQALNSKRQTLVNKQLFLNVEYSYKLTSYVDGIAYYTVTFYVEDSKTLLALPYPKFDNDKTGFLFGIKAKDTNLFGTFGLLNFTGYVSQNDGTLESWDNRKDYLEFDIKDVAIRDSKLSLNFLYEREKTTKPDGRIKYDIDWLNLRFKETRFSFSVDGIIDPIATQEFNYEVLWTGLKLFGKRLNFKIWAENKPTSNFAEMNPNIQGFSWSYGPFKQNDGRYTLSNALEWNTNLTNFKTETSLVQHDLTFFTRPLSFKIDFITNKKVDQEYINDATLSSTLGTNFKLPLTGVTWATSVTPGMEYRHTKDTLAYYWEYTNTLSNRGSINFISNKHKFREGIVFNFKHVYRDYQQVEYEYLSYWYAESNITWFPLIIGPFNPNLRFNGFYSGLNPKKYYFLPSENKNVSEYFRGYLSRSSAITYEDGLIPYGGVLNLNLTMEFIDFGFAKSYANPFLDIGIFGDPNSEDGYSLLASAGLEGWGVLRRFPSHPMRAALGFNLFDVVEAVQKKRAITDVEWELSISFELYY